MSDDNDGVDGVDIDSGVLEPEDSLDDRGVDDVFGTDGELYDNQVGVARSGRLLEGDDPAADYPYLYATDVGIDGGAASAEEAPAPPVPRLTPTVVREAVEGATIVPDRAQT